MVDNDEDRRIRAFLVERATLPLSSSLAPSIEQRVAVTAQRRPTPIRLAIAGVAIAAAIVVAVVLLPNSGISIGPAASRSPSTHPAAVASSTAGLSETPSAAPIQGRPPVACDPPGHETRPDPSTGLSVPVTPVSCQSAVDAALAVIAPDTAIARIEFHYGGYCPPTARCPFISHTAGFVEVFGAQGSPDLMVTVSMDDNGTVTASPPKPLPPDIGQGGVGWTTSIDADLEGPGTQHMTAVTSFWGGFLAIGSDGGRPTVWSSPDGNEWTKTALSPDGQVSAIAASDDRIVGVGSVERDQVSQALIWISSDGRSWTSVPVDPAVFPAGSSSGDLVYADGAFIAVGGISPEAGQLEGAVPAIWRSFDAITWMRDDDLSFEAGVLASVDASGGTVVAGGSIVTGIDTSDPQTDAAVLTSKDGVAWTLVVDKGLGRPGSFGGPGAQSVISVVGHSGGFLMVGMDREERCQGIDLCAAFTMVHWTSSDGMTWRRTDVGQPLPVWPIAGGTVGLVAMRFDGETAGTPVRSTDGRIWTSIAESVFIPPGAITTSLVERDGTIVVVGSSETSGDQNARTWRLASP
jgi:hypothetical protein